MYLILLKYFKCTVGSSEIDHLKYFFAYAAAAAAAAKSLQSCPTLCDPMDCSPPGSSVHGIFRARVLEWAATVFSFFAYTFGQIGESILTCRVS